MVGAVIWPSSRSVMMLPARGRKPSIARMSEAKVLALPGAAGRKAERVEQVVRRGRCGGGAEP